jgi:hypothetical protein
MLGDARFALGDDAEALTAYDRAIANGYFTAEDIANYTEAKKRAAARESAGEPSKKAADIQDSALKPMAAIGDRLTFGSYLGDGIEWRVLAAEDGRMLVIAEQILDARPYNDEPGQVTWETSTLRAWLNDEFYNETFSEAEKARILETNVLNGNNPNHGTPGGNDTLDRVFLLSLAEAVKYFRTDEDRATTLSAMYQWKRGANIDRNWMWWLRSPGRDSACAACVYPVGSIYEGDNVDYTESGVRPALWLIPQIQ